MLELSYREFFEKPINILRALMDELDSMQEQTGHISREKEILRKNKKEVLEIKNTIAEMNDFSGLISRHEEGRISKLETVSKKFKEVKREKRTVTKKKQNRISKDSGATTKGVTNT